MDMNDTSIKKNWMWHLKKTQADLAWDYTKGLKYIKIAIIDQPPDVEHPDLETKIYPHYDPYSYKNFGPALAFFHGTVVASFAAAETQEFDQGSNNRQLCSMGFNTEIYAYTMNDYYEKALHASNVLKADVISISFFHSCYRDPTGNDSIMIKEILDNGTVIVAAAGNGFCLGCYNDSKRTNGCDSIPPDFEHFSTLYPFSENYDERIITVSGTDSLDYFTYYVVNDSTLDSTNVTHSYFTGVDVCAPGHHIMGASPTLRFEYVIDTITGDTLEINIVNNPWPYYGGWGGTSFATPIVAGLAALIKSINPCFTPTEIQNFIKSTTDTILDANLYLDGFGVSQTGTGRINAYNAVLMALENYTQPLDYYITDGQTIIWDEDKTANIIRIFPGGELTIKSQVIFNENSKILVEGDGRLIIDGGHLTTCSGCWHGIEVCGDKNYSQLTPNIQGYVELKDSAVIENAIIGISAYKRDEPFNYTGGIIIAKDAYFINNRNAIEFYPYENFNPYNPHIMLNNISSIKNCTFDVNELSYYNFYHINTSEAMPVSFVLLNGVRGIKIQGNMFLNSITVSDTNLTPNDWWNGILSYNSGFYVDEYCIDNYIPCTNTKPNVFERLNKGIFATSEGIEKTIEIKNSEFLSCKTGVYMGGVSNPEITSNTFLPIYIDSTNLGYDTALYKNEIFGGLYIDACTGYKVEENMFNVSGPFTNPQTHSIGIVVNNSGEQYNEIYNNQIENLYVGILAQNNNRGDSLGLCLKCNDMKDNEYDIAVTLDTNLRGWGIARYQGSPEDTVTAPANNSFSYGTANYSDIYNDGERIDYFHTYDQSAKKLEPQLYSENVYPQLNEQDYSKDSSCPSSLGSGIDPGAIESKIIESETIITNKNSELNYLVDGGDTEELNTDVQISVPPEAMQVRQQLMNESPYLSDTVMKSAINKENVLPNAMIRDVLVANPQSAKSDNVLDALDERFNQMPDYMMAQIMQGKYTTSAKENLEAEIQNWKGKCENAYSNILSYYIKDTTLNSFDSVLYWLQTKNTIDARYRLAFKYLSDNDTSLVNSVLSGITDDFVLNTTQNLIHQDYLSYFEIMNTLVSQGKTIMESDSAQIVSLQTLANNDNYLPGIYARNILIALAKINYHEPYILPNPFKATEAIYYPVTELEKKNYLKIFPNPARNFIIVEYNTDLESYLENNVQHNIILRFTDMNGKLIRIQHFNNTRDQIVISTKSFNPGVYICNLFVDGKLIDTSKFTIF